jgi:hypothetical protein
VSDAVPPPTDADRAKLAALEKAGAAVHGPDERGGYVVRVEGAADLAAAFANLKGLRCATDVTLASDRLADADLAAVAGLDYLRAFALHDCPRVSGAGLGALTKLPRLKAVSVVGPLTDAAAPHLARIATLEEVALVRTKLTDAGLKELAGLPLLDTLDLTGTPATGVAFAAPGWGKLRELNATGTAFADPGWRPSPGSPRWRSSPSTAHRLRTPGWRTSAGRSGCAS